MCNLLIVIVGTLLVFPVLFNAEEYKWQCRKKMMNHWEEIPDSKAKCVKQYDAAPQMHNSLVLTGELCKAFCMGQRLDVFTREPNTGAVNHTGVKTRIDYHIEKELYDEMNGRLQECDRNHGSGVEKGPTDSFCLNYVPYWTCIWLSAMEVCKTQFDPKILGIDILVDKKYLE